MTTQPKYPIRYYKKSHHYTEDMTEVRDREAYVYITEHGAVEAWRTKTQANGVFPSGYFGGIEYHCREPQWEEQTSTPGNCDLLASGTCFHDGSSLAFDDVQHEFNNPQHMYQELAWRARHYWGGDDD